MKYDFTELKEYSEKELLSMEKEMLGIYISGHPLEKYREEIEKKATINTMIIEEAESELQTNGECNLRDNSSVKFVGIITKIKKKFTKSNKIMAFITVEDLYGSCEVIVFESCYNNASKILFEESIVSIDGRLSIREDKQDITIIANSITDLKINPNKLVINITNLNDTQKEKLRGAIKFFKGDKNNLQVIVKQGQKESSCGAIFATDEIIKEFEYIVGQENIE